MHYPRPRLRPCYDHAGIRLFNGDCRTVLAALPAESVQCVVTSPPYWGLRDYGVDGQLGLEPTLDEYVVNMVAVFRAVRRVLRTDGTCWVNLGDGYSSGGRATFRSGVSENKGHQVQDDMPRPDVPAGLKPKDLLGVPWRIALALQADGWWLRSDIIWAKPNPMPESVTDRPTRAHEYLFLLTRRDRYFYDAEAVRESARYGYRNHPEPWGRADDGHRIGGGNVTGACPEFGRNLRDVWTISTQGYPNAHFATFPEKLVEPCLKAGTSERGACSKCLAPWRRVVKRERKPTRPARDNVLDETGMANRDPQRHVTETKTTGWEPTCKCKAGTVPCVVLDPFAGSGTTLAVAKRLFCHAIGIELNSDYCGLAVTRLPDDLLPLTLEVSGGEECQEKQQCPR